MAKTNTSLVSLHKNNTKIRVSELGDVEIKYISFGDTKNFLKLLSDKKLSDKEFVQKLLFNQLIQPEMSLERFKELPDVGLLKIARDYVRNESHTFQYFKDTGNLYSDFRSALETYEKKQFERLENSFRPIIAEITKSKVYPFVYTQNRLV